MADTRVQLEVEDWVRENWMQTQFSQNFHRKRLKLSSGGVFDFDAVSSDGAIAASISTSASTTSGGKHGTGKLMKLRSDMLFLLMAEQPTKRLMILTEVSMYATCLKEIDGGRVPSGIEFFLAKIPVELESRLVQSREKASKEVSPRKILEQLPDELLLKT
ncbi:hypothetical protein AYO42_04705 [Rhizomicrobium sp. SCGC AG-212-E05]|nr:hypothetical protein AYO42_04705 [Rhizomicrobium sp. SCGC AG-212-E05]